MPRASRLVDVSVLLSPGLATHPGNPPFEFSAVQRVAEGAPPNVSQVTMGTGTGTHVSAPRHCFGPDHRRIESLSDADAGAYELYRLPLKIKDGDGAPARVVLTR